MADPRKRPVLQSLVECPPITHQPVYHFVRINPGSGKKLRILGDMVYGVNTHWTRHESQFCTLHTGACIWCSERAPIKWNGYIMVAMPTTRTHHVLHVTKACYQYCERMHQGQPPLTDLEINVYRRGTRYNSPLCAAFSEHPWAWPLPQVPDIRDVLERVFGLPPHCLTKGGAE
jgi:hypothetical protein